ncbi:MAG: hypothetical protein JKX73_01230 [Flavobacteriales bacterium]|nr:hypothetical protein [Flavobacteriales bacterium]
MNLEDLENDEPFGQKIYESIPKGARAEWGVKIIGAVAKHLNEVPDVVKELIAIVEDGSHLSQTKEQFGKINEYATANPNFNPAAFLQLAEGVAKMIFNETGLPEPFGVQAGWYVPLSAKRAADHIDKPDLDEALVKLIFKNVG